MAKTIHVRNVPDEVHREAKARAAREGISLSAYVLWVLKRSLEVPPIDEVPPVEEVLARRRLAHVVGRDDPGDPRAAVAVIVADARVAVMAGGPT